MDETEPQVTKDYGENSLRWFKQRFEESLWAPLTSQFPNHPLPRDLQAIVHSINAIKNAIKSQSEDPIRWETLLELLSKKDSNFPLLFKRITLLYRRHRATETERLTEKTFHLRLTETLEQEKKSLETLTSSETFLQIPDLRLPRLKDFLPVQFIESAAVNQIPLQDRQYDEKFHILQAPQLFLADLAHFRAKCEDRETPISIAFIDIDDFKSLNTRHTETKVDRNLLPQFMQAMEAHMFHHGYAYRQGGDEYLLLLPSLSRSLSIRFLDELRIKLASLTFPDIAERTTVSIGLCVADADCPLTDRELLDRANRAKQFAKQSGKNCIATYGGPRFIDRELKIVAEPSS